MHEILSSFLLALKVTENKSDLSSGNLLHYFRILKVLGSCIFTSQHQSSFGMPKRPSQDLLTDVCLPWNVQVNKKVVCFWCLIDFGPNWVVCSQRSLWRKGRNIVVPSYLSNSETPLALLKKLAATDDSRARFSWCICSDHDSRSNAKSKKFSSALCDITPNKQDIKRDLFLAALTSFHVALNKKMITKREQANLALYDTNTPVGSKHLLIQKMYNIKVGLLSSASFPVSKGPHGELDYAGD